MLPKSLLFTGLASAFLVLPESLPPKVKDIKDTEEENAFNILPIDIAANVPALDLSLAERSDLSLPCAECTHGDALQFHFTIEDSTHLTLNNGFEIFPEPDPMRHALTAEVDSQTLRREKLGYSISTVSGGLDKEQGMEVVDIEIKVLTVGRKPVHRVPSVKITLLTAENGMLYIANTKMIEPAPKPKCHSMLCALKEMLGGFKGRMGCHGGKAKSALKDAANQAYGHGVPAMHNAQQKAEEIIKEEHDRFKEKFGGHHHHHRGGIFRLVKNFVSHIVLPVILGISAGVGVAALAMVTANAIMFITRCLCGRRDEDDATEVIWYENVATMGYPAGVKGSELPTSDKDGLLENQAAAPEYYGETENEKV